MDLGRVVGRLRHVVLDERTALEHRDLRGSRPHVHAHEVATDGTPLALAASLPGERLLVDLERAVTEIGGDRLSGLRSAPATPATSTPATASGRRRALPSHLLQAASGAGIVSPICGLRGHEDSLGYLGIVDLPFHRAVRELGLVVVVVVLEALGSPSRQSSADGCGHRGCHDGASCGPAWTTCRRRPHPRTRVRRGRLSGRLRRQDGVARHRFGHRGVPF